LFFSFFLHFIGTDILMAPLRFLSLLKHLTWNFRSPPWQKFRLWSSVLRHSVLWFTVPMFRRNVLPASLLDCKLSNLHVHIL
jgi:hypothetical protein